MYIVIELQTNNGKTGSFVYSFSDLADAYAKYFGILSAAAKSTVGVHTALLITEKGNIVRAEHFEHVDIAEQ